MADKKTEIKTVNLTAEFGDGTERSFSQNNPIDDETTLIQRINALSAQMALNQIMLSNNDASFVRIKSAKISTRATTTLDL